MLRICARKSEMGRAKRSNGNLNNDQKKWKHQNDTKFTRKQKKLQQPTEQKKEKS